MHNTARASRGHIMIGGHKWRKMQYFAIRWRAHDFLRRAEIMPAGSGLGSPAIGYNLTMYTLVVKKQNKAHGTICFIFYIQCIFPSYCESYEQALILQSYAITRPLVHKETKLDNYNTCDVVQGPAITLVDFTVQCTRVDVTLQYTRLSLPGDATLR